MTVSKSWALLSIPAGLFTSAALTLYNAILGNEVLNGAVVGFIVVTAAFLIIAVLHRK